MSVQQARVLMREAKEILEKSDIIKKQALEEAEARVKAIMA